jgi:hypothetical protein
LGIGFDSIHLKVKKNTKNILENKGYFYFVTSDIMNIWEYEKKPAAKGSPESKVVTNLIYSEEKKNLTIPKIIDSFSQWTTEDKKRLPVIEMISRGDFPIDQTLLPMFKRKLISYVGQKQMIENYKKSKEEQKI